MTMNEATLFQPESLKKYSTTNPAIPIELPITTTLQFEQPGKKDQHSFDVLNTTTQKCLPLSSAAFLLDQQPCYNNLLPSGSNMENMPVNNLALNAFDQQQEIAINEFDDFLLHQLTQNDMDILLSLVPNVIAASDSDAVIDSIIELPLEYCQPKKKTHFSTNMEQIELIENNFISESSLQQQQQQDNVISSGSIDWQNISAALLERELQSDDNREYQSGTRLEEAKQQPSLPDEEANFSCPSEEEKEDMNGSSQGEFGIRTCLWANCEEKFDHLQALVSHLSEIHMGRGKSTYRCEWKDCARIDNPFTKRHKMYAHLRIHTGERPFVCPKPGCNKQFTRPDSLTNHIKTHSKVRPFICRWKGCGKAYFYSRSLKKHEKIHEDAEQMPYQIESITQPYLQLQQSDLLARNANPVFVPLYQSSLDFTNCQTSKLL